MRDRLHPRLLLFIIFIVWTTGAASAFTLAVTGSADAQLSAADGYLPKAQLGGEAGVDLLFPVNRWLALGGTAGILGANASDLLGGFGYRSHIGGYLGILAEASAPLASWRYVGALRGGGRLRTLANIAGYGNTTLAFFFPSLGLDGFLVWSPAALPFLDVGLAIPLRINFRRDMQFSGSVGLGLTVAVTKKATP